MEELIQLFKPYVSLNARFAVARTLKTSWIGQGPQVDEFEKLFENKISNSNKAVAVNSGTSALHLAYILANIQEGDEVICPVFSCAATMMPVLYQKAKIVFADIDPNTMNIDPVSVMKLMNHRVKAIVCMDYGGNPCDLYALRLIADSYNIPLIEDAAQSVGAMIQDKFNPVNIRFVGEIADFTCFSFQAIKNLTTVDGGMLTIADDYLVDKAKRLRWFGIDRKAKFENRWSNDITEVGYKYQMNDVAASMGIEGLNELEYTLSHKKALYEEYATRLANIPGLKVIKDEEGKTSTHWMITVLVEKREALMKKLKEHHIESGQVHYRCDKYSVFGGKVDYCKNMDSIEDKYLVLPSHFYVTVKDVDRICDVIKGGW